MTEEQKQRRSIGQWWADQKAERSAKKIDTARNKYTPPAVVNFFDSSGELQQEDLRAKIKVPLDYLNADAMKGTPGIYELAESGGIVFPYTPSISYSASASWADSSPVHSNYAQYFYKNSKISEISITAQYTVQNARDAAVWLATKHLLVSLTKMRFGVDSDAGSPPPVCRLFAYGDYMMKDVPIVIGSVRVDLPADVDYYNLGKPLIEPPTPTDEEKEKLSYTKQAKTQDLVSIAKESAKFNNIFGQSFVPTTSKFVLTCYPVYSRNEILNSGVQKFLETYRENPKYL